MMAVRARWSLLFVLTTIVALLMCNKARSQATFDNPEKQTRKIPPDKILLGNVTLLLTRRRCTRKSVAKHYKIRSWNSTRNRQLFALRF